ncbi:hypothetical protein ACFCV9_02035 [Streptomyces sp. NPDC056367]|uniref:hypothetical protein n=1 Tax=Streptomyces sp. NPDC056367 TaxID=3345797 RepID=UPI0035E3BCA9
MRRRTLPLLLAALLTASGCVTVSGSGVRDDKPPAARTSPAGTPAAAWPLTQLPASADPAPVTSADGPEQAGASDAPGQRTELRREPDTGRPAADRRSGHLPRTESAPKPKPRAKPKAEPKRRAPGAKPAAPRRSGPAPAPGRIDMAELCRSSQGVTSPAITQLCTGTYGR